MIKPPSCYVLQRKLAISRHAFVVANVYGRATFRIRLDINQGIFKEFALIQSRTRVRARSAKRRFLAAELSKWTGSGGFLSGLTQRTRIRWLWIR